MLENLIQPFEAAINQFKKRDQLEKVLPAIGYFCTYTPIEVIHAAGFTPIRITGDAGAVEKAYAHMPDFICPFMKRALEKALNGKYDFLSGVVQGYSCDAACGAVNIWRDAIGGGIYHTLPLPYNSNPEARAFYKSALNEVVEKLNALGGSFSESKLDSSLGLYTEIRNILLDFYERSFKGDLPLSTQQMLTLIEAGAVSSPEAYLDMLKALKTHLRNANAEKKQDIPVMISGSLVEDPTIIEMIESSGGRIVADDLCNGYRQLVPAAADGGSPVDRLINRYIQRMPCPARSRAEDRLAPLIELMQKSGAKAMILIIQKFCTPHLSDYPSLLKAFKEKGWPVLLLELDESWQPGGQIKTRLESFFEMVGA